jgi:LuxR family maltose regulon positive regulatory protein
MKRRFISQNPQIVSEDELYLERPRLMGSLERALACPVTSVVAGEGYGKTHSVYSFLRNYDAVTTWIQVSERDNRAQRFWENYTGAVSLYHRNVGNLLANLGFPETTRQFDRYMTLLQQELIAQIRYVLVLDDFHLIRDSPVLRFLDRYLAAVPLANRAIVLVSRKEPAINSLSLLSKGRLSRITVEDLRFTEQETGDYFALQNIPLSPEELARVYRETEGWALALNLLAREARHREPRRLPRTLRGIGSFRALEEEIFGGLRGELRKFLIKLSLIEHWPLELLKDLTPDPGIIEEMETFSSFIRYDIYLHGYRIHHLFLEFLREKQGELRREEAREVYLKAAQWCIENNLRMDAALEYERAREFQGLTATVDSFPRVLPNAMAAFFMEIVDRILALDAAELPAEGEPGYEDFAYLRYVIRPRLLLGLGRIDESIKEAYRSIEKFENLASSPLSSKILAFCYNMLGTLGIITSRVTRNHKVSPLFEQSYRYYLRHPIPLKGPITRCCVGSYVNQTGYPAEPGELDRALRDFSPAVVPASNSFNGYLYGMDSLGWAEYNLFSADLNNAEKFARQAVFKAREKNQAEIENRALFFLLRTSLNTGTFAGVEEALKQLNAQLENPEFLNRYILHDIVTGWFYAQIGQTGKIASWLKNDFEESELNTMFHGFETLVKAKCSFAEKRYEGVLTTLSLPGGRHGLGEFILGRLEMTALQGVTLFKLGEKEKALAALEDAWDMAAPNNLDMPFIELGEDMRALTGAALAAEKAGPIPRPWLESIRSRASIYAKKLQVVVEQYEARRQSHAAPVMTLSFREMEVLKGLSQGLTREEIAGEAALSINTVKNVISSIYAKLGAKNRADAIRIATGAGLIPGDI